MKTTTYRIIKKNSLVLLILLSQVFAVGQEKLKSSPVTDEITLSKSLLLTECRANDVSVVKFFIAKEDGTPLENTCIPNIIQNAYVYAVFTKNAEAARYSLKLEYDIYINGVQIGPEKNPTRTEVCLYDKQKIPIEKDESVTVRIQKLDWACGDRIEFKDFYMSWQSTINESCGASNAKCFRAEGFVVDAPLIANFTHTLNCNSYKVDFNSTTTGGDILNPYTYEWDINGTKYYSKSLSHTFTYPGTYTVKLSVFSGIIKDSQIHNVVVHPFLQGLTLTVTDAPCSGGTGSIYANGTTGGYGNYTYSISPTPAGNVQNGGQFSNLPVGTYTITVTDENNCSINKTATIGIADTTDPIIKAPNVVNVEGCTTANITNGNQTSLPYSTSAAPITESQFLAEGGTFTEVHVAQITYQDTYIGTCPIIVSRKFTITDDCGKSAFDIQTININDTAPPTLPTPPSNMAYQCIGDVPAPGVLTANDNCSGAITSTGVDVTNNSDPCKVVITRTWTFRDACNNSSSVSQTITVRDTTVPVVPAAPTNTAYQCADDVPAPGVLTAKDNCAGDITVTGVDTTNNSDPCNVVITRTWTFTDACNNSSYVSQKITVSDTTAPVAPAAPADIAYQCSGDVPASIALTANDNCSGDITVTGVDTTNNSDPCKVVITRTWTFTDACNNSSSVSQKITVSDTIAPVAPAAPADIAYQCSGDVPASITLTANDNCSGDITITGVDTTNNSDPCKVVITRTWTFTDACNNSSSVSQKITVSDTIAPVAPAVPANTAYQCADDVPAPGVLTAKDNCAGDITVTGVDTTNNSDPCNVVITRTWTFTDACNNSSYISQTITVSDTIAPKIDKVAADQTVLCDGTGNTNEFQAWLDTHAGSNATDNCSSVTWSYNILNIFDQCGETSRTLVRFIAKDDCDNESTTTALFTIIDLVPPTLNTFASDLIVECDGLGNTNDLNEWLANNGGGTATDLCGNVTWSNNFTALSDGCGVTGSATVKFTATDDCGNFESTTATFTIEKTTPPALAGGANGAAECTGSDPSNNAAYMAWRDGFAGITSSDTCGDTELSYVEGTWSSDSCTDSITVTFTATDECGLTSSQNQSFTISDTTAPELAGGTNGSAESTGIEPSNNAAYIAWRDGFAGITSSDDCGNTTMNFAEGSWQSTSCGDSVIVTFTATDECGLTSEKDQMFTISDDTPPTLSGGTDGTAECTGSDPVANAIYIAWRDGFAGITGSDISGNVTMSFSEGFWSSTGCTDIITVTFTATDECLLTTSQDQIFTISDTTAPSIDTEASNSTVECDGAGNTTELNAWLASNGGAVASDGCSGVTWTNDFSALSDDCGLTGTASVIFTATDECGLSSTTSATFTIEDKTPPTIDTDAANSTVECDGAGNTTEFDAWLASNGGAIATDGCSGVTWSNNFSALSDDCGLTGTASVIFTATDECGLSSTTSATFTIEDRTPPTIDTDAANSTVECDGTGNTAEFDAWLASNGGAIASEGCSGVTWTNDFSALSDDCGLTGTASVIFTATDECGLSSTTSATFTIEDKTPPTIDTDAANSTVECDGAGNTAEFNAWLASNGGAIASDGCSGVTWTNDFSALSDDCGLTGTASVIFTATDECGLSSTTSATFTIEDKTPPTIDTDAANSTVECDGAGNTTELNAWLASNGGAIASDGCSGVTWTNDFSALSDDCGSTGTASVIFTATDACGNASTSSASFTIEDKTPPTMDTDAANSTVECDGAGNTAEFDAWLASNGGATASDICAGVTWTNNFSALSDDCGLTGTASVIFTATDACGNASTSSASFTIEDTTPPTIDTDAANSTVECDGAGNATEFNAWLASNGGATASDICAGVTWTNDFNALSDDCGATGSATVTFTATDDCGNTATASATFTIEDTTPPVIDIAATNLTVECDGNGNVDDLNNWLASQGGASASDACSSVTWTNNYSALSDDCGATGSASVTFTATDDCGNTATASATFTIEDTAPPVIDIAATNLTVECDGNGNVDDLNNWLASQGGASASESCSNVTWTNNFSALFDDCGTTGSASVTFTATDDCGNTATASATFTIEDTAPPAIDIVATNLTVECDGNGNVDDLNNWLASQGGASASDACSSVTWTSNYSALSDECGATGSASVTFTATDDCGNTATASATFTIEDTAAPVLDIAATNIVVECDGNGNNGAIQDWLDNNGNAMVSDACSSVTWTNNYDGTASDCSAPVEVTFTATDECGNAVSTMATYTIQDSVPPVITGGTDLTVQCDGNGNVDDLNNWLIAQGGAIATDDCSAISWSNDFNMLSDECGATGSATVTFTATDGCGNSASMTATFTIEDTTPPVIDIAATNLTVECDGNGNVDDLNNWLASQGGASASDACSNVTWTSNYSTLSDECGATGSASVTFTATDDCGNTATASATFTIEDTTPPTIDIAATNLTVECDGNGNVDDLNNWLASQGGASASDACSSVTWTSNYSTLSDECGATGSASVTFTATDDCGNTATASATFTIEDTTPPVIDIVATDLTVECDGNGNEDDLNNWLAAQGGASASDACSSVTWTSNYSTLSDECGATGSASVTFTATDDCGNTATASATFTIEDTTPPVIDIAATNLTVECDGNGNVDDLNNWLASQGGASASDACSSVTWTSNYSTLSDDCGTTGSASVTFTTTDDCGNTATASATFTIEDTTPPVIDIVATDLTVECDGNGNEDDLNNWLAAQGGASASDACSSVTWTSNYSALSDDCGATGSASVTFTATDDCGNTATASATFTIEDTTPPVIDIAATNLTVECDGNGNVDDLNNWLASQGGASASDACSNVTWTSNYSTLSDECGATGSASVTFTATDDCGNIATASATFTIEDTTPPTIDIVATNLTVECDGNGNVDDLNNWLASQGGASASDACSSVTWTSNYSTLSDECGATGSATVTFTATDDCGNTATASATFTIEDTTPPVIDIVATDLIVECDGNGNVDDLNNWLASQGGASASDACSNVTWTSNYSTLSDDCGATGSATVTFTATDDCGNTATASATFTIEDTIPPVINVTAVDLTVECDGTGNMDDLNNWLDSMGGASATDNCSTVTWTNDFTALSNGCGNTGSAVVNFTATDDCGNKSTTTATFAIVDTTAPVVVGDFETVINVNCDMIPGIPSLVFQDACSTNMTVTGPTEVTNGDINSNYQIVRTWTVSDECNSYVYTQTVNVTVQNASVLLSNDLCQDVSPLDLFDELPNTVDKSGTWVVKSGNANLNGSEFDQSNAPFGPYVFTYTETKIGQCPVEYEVTITVIDCVVLSACDDVNSVEISTTVTPNGDVYNEYFTVGGIEDCGFTIELQIFNRWGAKIYENNNYQNDWNGFTSKASIGSSDKVPTGTYYYIINLKNSGFKPFAGPLYVATK